MKYEDLVAQVKAVAQKARVSRIVGHAAFQFNIEGEAEGAFYIELTGGKINVEPFEYYDRDVLIVTKADIVLQMLSGKIKPREAYANGFLHAYGDVELLDVLPFEGKKKKMQI